LSLDELRSAERVVRRTVAATPAYAWPLLGEAVGGTVWLKHENQTPTGAFKVRGGLAYVDRLLRERPAVRGIVSATRGNHGQSLAYAGRAAGLRVVIVVPHGNSPEKNAAMEAFGAELVVYGEDFQEARERAAVIAETEGLEPVPPFHPDLVAGVASYALELFQQAGPLDAVVVPVGMGSGICGLINVRDALGLTTEIEQAPATALSYAAGGVRATPRADTFVDGVACRVPDETAIATIVAGAADVVTVTEDDAAEALRLVLRTTHQLAEPAGSLAVAALIAHPHLARGRTVAAILSGGNCDGPLLAQVLAGATPTAG
jgi:threonine dehydratase